MIDFCPECSNLLRKRTMNGKAVLHCRCGYQKECEIDQEDVDRKIQQKKKALDKNLIIVNPEDKITVNVKIRNSCPKCGHHTAEAWQEQTRSADEPSTSFFKCEKCKFSWREY